MAIIDNVISNVDKGVLGLNEGLSIGFDKLIEYIPNLQQGTVYVIGGQTASGKTSFSMSTFIYNPYEDYLKKKAAGEDVKLNILLYSMEMSADMIISRAVCREIFKKHNIVVDVNYILSRGKNRISQEIYDKVVETHEYFVALENVMEIDHAINPTGIARRVKALMMQEGKIITEPIKIMDEAGNPKTLEKFVRYESKYANHYVIVVLDHVSLLRQEQGLNTKGTIDKAMEYLTDYKIKFNITPIIIQQLNRNIESSDRVNKYKAIEVQLSDFRDTSDTTHNAEFVLGLNHPWRFEYPEYRGYKTAVLQDRFRSLKILKTRDGSADIIVGLGFLGEVGAFSELPAAVNMTQNDYNNLTSIQKRI